MLKPLGWQFRSLMQSPLGHRSVLGGSVPLGTTTETIAQTFPVLQLSLKETESRFSSEESSDWRDWSGEFSADPIDSTQGEHSVPPSQNFDPVQTQLSPQSSLGSDLESPKTFELLHPQITRKPLGAELPLGNREPLEPISPSIESVANVDAARSANSIDWTEEHSLQRFTALPVVDSSSDSTSFQNDSTLHHNDESGSFAHPKPANISSSDGSHLSSASPQISLDRPADQTSVYSSRELEPPSEPIAADIPLAPVAPELVLPSSSLSALEISDQTDEPTSPIAQTSLNSEDTEADAADPEVFVNLTDRNPESAFSETATPESTQSNKPSATENLNIAALQLPPLSEPTTISSDSDPIEEITPLADAQPYSPSEASPVISEAPSSISSELKQVREVDTESDSEGEQVQTSIEPSPTASTVHSTSNVLISDALSIDQVSDSPVSDRAIVPLEHEVEKGQPELTAAELQSDLPISPVTEPMQSLNPQLQSSSEPTFPTQLLRKSKDSELISQNENLIQAEADPETTGSSPIITDEETVDSLPEKKVALETSSEDHQLTSEVTKTTDLKLQSELDQSQPPAKNLGETTIAKSADSETTNIAQTKIATQNSEYQLAASDLAKGESLESLGGDTGEEISVESETLPIAPPLTPIEPSIQSRFEASPQQQSLSDAYQVDNHEPQTVELAASDSSSPLEKGSQSSFSNPTQPDGSEPNIIQSASSDPPSSASERIPDSWTNLSELLGQESTEPSSLQDTIDSLDAVSQPSIQRSEEISSFELPESMNETDREDETIAADESVMIQRQTDLISPADPIAHDLVSPTATSPQARSPTDEELDQLALVIYSRLRLQFVFEREKTGAFRSGHSLSLGNFILPDRAGTTSSQKNSSQAMNANSNIDKTPTDAHLEKLTAEINTLLQFQIEFDRERHTVLYF